MPFRVFPLFSCISRCIWQLKRHFCPPVNFAPCVRNTGEPDVSCRPNLSSLRAILTSTRRQPWTASRPTPQRRPANQPDQAAAATTSLPRRYVRKQANEQKGANVQKGKSVVSSATHVLRPIFAKSPLQTRKLQNATFDIQISRPQ